MDAPNRYREFFGRMVTGRCHRYFLKAAELLGLDDDDEVLAELAWRAYFEGVRDGFVDAVAQMDGQKCEECGARFTPRISLNVELPPGRLTEDDDD